ncbi:peptidase M23 [Maribrevibacterium harenarium]|jgi:septal ring factor EnvC (AmiA/AmiB activator)|uniref:Peptidase M23 n=1 Tax=Maribrevibacterium harenarium TaxID=2589817 RepID=A0A501X1J8_9GAMM|nr:peptidoglycan DD-metalloendopeptidase family protein [Maribrevibacterium harenarium]TPE54348.1 peptidase M23 [Maribrevibacterium harenarium]
MLVRTGLVILGMLLASLSWSAAPQTPQEARAQIEALQKELQQLSTWMKELKSERSDVEQQLESKEQAIQNLQNKIRDLMQDLKAGEAQLSQLQIQQRELQLSIEQQHDQIAAQLRAVYRSGNDDGLRFLLDGQSPAQTMRLIHYNRYFSQARQGLINGYATQVNELHLVEKSIRSRRAQLLGQQQELQAQQASLQQEQQQRQKLLVRLDKDLQTSGKRAQRLTENQAQLKSLLERLEQALADIQIPDQDTPFKTQQGKLIRPLANLSVLPDNSQVNLGGVTYAAKEGEQVRSVFHGRVVFADWMRGFGFLVIIDHGEGYMSLYGYNQSLLREVGEWVNANDVIATAGSSGGRTETGLFFALRYNGQPLSPQTWVK